MLATAPMLGLAGLILKLVNPELLLGNLLINLFLLGLFLAITIVPHELGHALAARLCGFDVYGIVVGSGPSVFHTRIFGIPAEFKLLPIGGVALAEPTRASWLRTKWFIFVAAGPLVHALAIACAHLGLGIPLWPESLRRAGAGEVFVFANWIQLFVDLVPFVAHSSYGLLPNDGLALMQLLFLRRLPFIPNRKPSRKPRLLAWVGALLIWLFAALCFVLAWLAISDMNATRRIRSSLGTLSTMMGVALLWLGWRAAFSREERAQVAARYPQQVFWEELQQHAKVCLRHPLASEYHSHLGKKNWAAAEHTLLRMCSPESNPYVAAAIGDCREAAADYAGANEMYAVAEKLLTPEAAVWLKMQRVKMMLRLGDVAGASEFARSIVQSVTGAHKLVVLDGLACLPIMENLKSFLPLADEFSREALEIQPQNLTLKGTRGAILVELGRIDEAEPLLNEVHTTSEADHDQRISAFYLGLIAKARGDLNRARTFAAQSLIYPEKWLTERTQKELLN